VRVLIAGGGTGGHLTPALATAQALRDADPSGEVVVAGRRGGVAERLVTEAGLRLLSLHISGVDSSRPGTVARAVAQLPGATLAARRLLRRMRADVVVGAGGYVCVPVVVAALQQGVPVVLLEQNAYPGRATRLLARRAHVTASSFAETAGWLPGAEVVHTGNPVRREVLARRSAPLGTTCTRVLVTGGSQGARRLNRAIAGCVRRLLEDNPGVSVLHQSGALDHAEMQALAASMPMALAARYRVAIFFDDIADRIASSDLVMMRAGGSSLAECAVMGRPMVLVPYPHAGAHQAFNAEHYARGGAATLIDDEACTPERVRAEISSLLADTDRWRRMAAASNALGMPDATTRVVNLILATGGSRRHRNAA
jgi:UDP-N-acetylglucosamine--N-acetylmuramyl-(pentapeptide) pyrophosphoryl-undecaprenol N-acetylglucosamine transferase